MFWKAKLTCKYLYVFGKKVKKIELPYKEKYCIWDFHPIMGNFKFSLWQQPSEEPSRHRHLQECFAFVKITKAALHCKPLRHAYDATSQVQRMEDGCKSAFVIVSHLDLPCRKCLKYYPESESYIIL